MAKPAVVLDFIGPGDEEEDDDEEAPIDDETAREPRADPLSIIQGIEQQLMKLRSAL